MAAATAAGAAGGALAVRNARLSEQLRAAQSEAEEARLRGVSIADRERRWIERDLHDYAQQTLVSVRIHLSMLQERLQAESPAEAAAAEKIGGQVEAALGQLRGLAQAVYPPLLARVGLVEALTTAGQATPLRVRVVAHSVERYRSDVETTVYFACVEALRNAAEPARGASAATINLRGDRDLVFEVRDDGASVGGPTSPGGGVENVRERLVALGGEMHVSTTLGEGTLVRGRVHAHKRQLVTR
jgi:signal transduction histidine kinase